MSSDDDLSKLVREIADRQEIYLVIMRYSRAVDRQDQAVFASVFHPDAIVEQTSPRPASDVVAQIAGLKPGPRMHLVANVLIELEGDVAFVESYSIAFGQLEKDGKLFSRPRGLRLLDRFERRGGEWKIAYRMMVDDWARLDEIQEAPSFDTHVGVSGPGDPLYSFREHSAHMISKLNQSP